MDLLRPFVAETVGGRTAVCRRRGAAASVITQPGTRCHSLGKTCQLSYVMYIVVIGGKETLGGLERWFSPRGQDMAFLLSRIGLVRPRSEMIKIKIKNQKKNVYCCEEEKQNARIQQPSQRPPPLTTSPRLSLTTLPNNAPTTPIQIAIQPQAHDEHELLDFLLGSLRLEQEVDVTARLPLHTLGLALEDLDEGVSDNLALLLGALHSLQPAQELLAGAIRWELRPMLVWLWQRFSAEDMTSPAATTKPILKTGR
jgi:hypothetical protein